MVRWSREETEKLIDGVAKWGKDWVKISRALLNNSKSNVDCKDKWRNLLLRKTGSERVRAIEESLRFNNINQDNDDNNNVDNSMEPKTYTSSIEDELKDFIELCASANLENETINDILKFIHKWYDSSLPSSFENEHIEIKKLYDALQKPASLIQIGEQNIEIEEPKKSDNIKSELNATPTQSKIKINSIELDPNILEQVKTTSIKNKIDENVKEIINKKRSSVSISASTSSSSKKSKQSSTESTSSLENDFDLELEQPNQKTTQKGKYDGEMFIVARQLRETIRQNKINRENEIESLQLANHSLAGCDKLNDNWRVSNLGVIKNIDTGEIVPMKEDDKGYLCVVIRGKKNQVHRYVCATFYGSLYGINERTFVNHKDGNKHNNYHANLEWVSDDENRKHFSILEYGINCRPVIVTNVKAEKKTIGSKRYFSCIFEAKQKLKFGNLTSIKQACESIYYKHKWEYDMSMKTPLETDNWCRVYHNFACDNTRSIIKTLLLCKKTKNPNIIQALPDKVIEHVFTFLPL